MFKLYYEYEENVSEFIFCNELLTGFVLNMRIY